MAPSKSGTMRSSRAIKATHASLAARVRFSPRHWAGSREPSRLKPGHSLKTS